ncbi:sulfate ABC transporter substrate-binding protein [Salmonella sp. SAL04286]|uniref:sulfate ABC transporter substrate-binding protein n=1 Tax=Salmonella sp. SAL04286 TaxID=3159864 RepID=UPI00397D8849
MKKWGVGFTLLLASTSILAKDIQLLNVSYDPTRELYEQYNKAFSAHWKQETGDNVVIRQSHGGSGKQATSVINGIEADVVTLALAYDVDAIAERGRIDKNWIKRLPDNSAPYTQMCIRDRGYALHHNNNDQAKAQDFVKALFKNVEVLDSGARGSTNTFVERGIGDVLIAWENEALLATNELGKDKFEIVTPSESILAEPTVSVVDKVVEKKDTKAVAEAYLKYLYSPEGQEIAAKNFYRPRDADVVKKYDDAFPKLKLFTIDEVFGGWAKAQKDHFANGGTFDQISKR